MLNPPQIQSHQPGIEAEMTPRPQSSNPAHQGSSKLKGKVALISGGDSGIGRATAIVFAREGAKVAILFFDEEQDAAETVRLVEAEGSEALAIPGTIGEEVFSQQAVELVRGRFGKLDIVVNNAAEQHPQKSLLDITAEQLERTFQTNVFGYFYLTKAALPYLKEGSSIITISSVTAYRGSPNLLDYSATKGAVVAFTRSLALSLADKGIRVNGVAPGPIWTPLIPSTFPKEKVEQFGTDTPLGRPGQPAEVAACCLFLASEDASYMTGQFLHPNGGEIING